MNLVVTDARRKIVLVLPAPTRQRRHVVVTSMVTSRLNRTFNGPFVSASATTVADRGDADAMPAFWAMSLPDPRCVFLRLQRHSSMVRFVIPLRNQNVGVDAASQFNSQNAGALRLCSVIVLVRNYSDKSISLFNQNYTSKIE